MEADFIAYINSNALNHNEMRNFPQFYFVQCMDTTQSEEHLSEISYKKLKTKSEHNLQSFYSKNNRTIINSSLIANHREISPINENNSDDNDSNDEQSNNEKNEKNKKNEKNNDISNQSQHTINQTMKDKGSNNITIQSNKKQTNTYNSYNNQK